MQEWESVCWRGSWFLGFLVSWFLGFKVSKFQNFKIYFMFSENISIPYYQISISCSQEDIDPIFKIFKKQFGRIVMIVRCPSFPTFSEHVGFPFLRFTKHMMFEMLWDFSWIVWSIMGSHKTNNIGIGARGHVRKLRTHWNEGFKIFPISKSKSYKFKLEQKNTRELLSTSFPWTYHKNDAKMQTNRVNMFVPLLPYLCPTFAPAALVWKDIGLDG